MTTTKKPWIFTPLNALRAANGVLEGNRTLTPEQREEFIVYCVEDTLNMDSGVSRMDIFRYGFHGFGKRSDAELAQAYLDASDLEGVEVAITISMEANPVTDPDLRKRLQKEVLEEVLSGGIGSDQLIITLDVWTSNGALESETVTNAAFKTVDGSWGLPQDLAIRVEDYYADQIKAAVEELLGGWDDE